ncbi:hypothetical protein M4L90_14220 [Staphylococcus equorum]|uniref:Phage protein n=1 Tax=Staphylococcus equorum TaxID=246432 RepID=A0A9X4QZX4_9STAP|nr:hypothetical protein [Staphylococcus equorum]MDG0820930.1 hypothetical protein [Staphylococcus equorum]MDG0841687.1 hypothetical protein [Staphylococcus equorum]MDG0847255.1 hypothetical protein [Staphylococcus equorum]
MKIKRKVEMNLPQLIEWAMENEIKNKDFESNDFESNDGFSVDTVTVEFDYLGRFGSSYNISKAKKFTVEVEEELTEDTFFKHLIKVTEDGEHYSTDFFKVRDLIHLGTEEVHAYIDGEYKLIWTHEKGLVE